MSSSTLASKGQAENIFKRMHNSNGRENETLERGSTLTDDDIARLAKQFAAKVPAGLLSPADIQDYIIRRRPESQRAIDNTVQ